LKLTASVDWGEEETQTHGDKTHLWEESWDDDDTTEDFANQLRLVKTSRSADRKEIRANWTTGMS
jgi:26 proteasome complex subunit DSS1